MSHPSNGITAEVIREVMPPYCLSPDLVDATFAALPPPPPDASTAWRHARITRLLGEIVAHKPADAAQARIASQILILREAANTLAAKLHASDATIEQLCRLGRAIADLERTATTLDRSLKRHQQQPVPFYGTVIEDEVDLAAVDAAWCNRASACAAAGPVHPTPPRTDPAGEAAPHVATPHQPVGAAPVAWRAASAPKPAANQADAAQPAADAGPSAPVAPRPLPAVPVTPTPLPSAPVQPTLPAAAAAMAAYRRRGRSADPATRPVLDGGKPTDWTITTLDAGPGWTREVLQHRSREEAAADAVPGSTVR